VAQVIEAQRVRLARNVAEGIRLPEVQRKDIVFLTARQVEQLADAIKAPYGTLVRFAAYTGLRPSELTALRSGSSTCSVARSVSSRVRPRSTGICTGGP
jgi:integrase